MAYVPDQTLIEFNINGQTTELYLVPWENDLSPDLPRIHFMVMGDETFSPSQMETYERLTDALCEDISLCANKDDPLAAAWHQFKIPNEDGVSLSGHTNFVHVSVYT